MFEKLKKLIYEQLGVDEDEVIMESSFGDDLGFDDLDMVELIMNAEEEFDIEIDAAGPDFNTVGEMVSYIQKKLE
ncbi:acyl carrier protein [Ruminiclostridium hungatei]|uniref:acyl carrier protein n=1 Tax=Ruminiclostridium hungatei TaxID=48256 RepID=UPI003BF583B0